MLGTEYYSYGRDERTNAYRVSVGNMKEKGRLQDLVVDVRAILKCISGGGGLEGVVWILLT